jgi:hypothetical protein
MPRFRNVGCKREISILSIGDVVVALPSVKFHRMDGSAASAMTAVRRRE